MFLSGIPLPLVWLALLIILAVVEGLTVGLVCIWFALGALAALLTSLFTGNLIVQAVVFVVVSLVSMLLIRPLARKLLTKETVPTNADRILGQTAVVTEEIDNLQSRGQVKVLGQIWTARSAQDVVIPTGTLVTVLHIEGVKVLVEPALIPADVSPL
jgi:membrane protein implicated in regulation of membrane protease activity